MKLAQGRALRADGFAVLPQRRVLASARLVADFFTPHQQGINKLLAKVELFVHRVVHRPFDAHSSHWEDETQRASQHFWNPRSFCEPVTGGLRFVDAFLALFAIESRQRQARMLTPQCQAEFGAGPFSEIEVAAIDRHEPEQPRTFFSFIGEDLHETCVCVIYFAENVLGADIQSIQAAYGLAVSVELQRMDSR